MISDTETEPTEPNWGTMNTYHWWDLILGQLRRRVADIHTEIILMHSDPEFLNPDTPDYKKLKENLAWAENYLFQAKEVRVYLQRLSQKEG